MRKQWRQEKAVVKMAVVMMTETMVRLLKRRAEARETVRGDEGKNRLCSAGVRVFTSPSKSYPLTRAHTLPVPRFVHLFAAGEIEDLLASCSIKMKVRAYHAPPLASLGRSGVGGTFPALFHTQPAVWRHLTFRCVFRSFTRSLTTRTGM